MVPVSGRPEIGGGGVGVTQQTPNLRGTQDPHPAPSAPPSPFQGEGFSTRLPTPATIPIDAALVNIVESSSLVLPIGLSLGGACVRQYIRVSVTLWRSLSISIRESKAPRGYYLAKWDALGAVVRCGKSSIALPATSPNLAADKHANEKNPQEASNSPRRVH